jgi:hypothetical protein
MIEQYAVINTEHGWLEFLVGWNKELYPLWQPPTGTYAVIASSIDISSLPLKPESDQP